MDEKYISTNIRLTESQYERLRKESFDTKKSQAEITREALEMRWAQKEKKEEKSN
jgi:predicted DNA-binding protein